MLSRYRKSVAALIGTFGTWWIAAFQDGTVTGVEWGALFVAISTVVAVWGVPNDAPDGEAADPNVSERDV